MFIVPHIQFGLPCHAVLCALTFEDFRTSSIFICATSRSCNKQVSFWGSSSQPPTRTPWVPQSHWHQQCPAACSCPQCRTRRTSDNPIVFFRRWSDNGIEDLFFLGRSGCFISRLYGLFGQEVRPPWALAQADAGKVMEWSVMYLNVRASRGNIAFASKRIDVYRLASGQWLVEAMHQFRIS